MRTQINDSVCCHLGHYTIKILIDWLIDSGSDLPGVGVFNPPNDFFDPESPSIWAPGGSMGQKMLHFRWFFPLLQPLCDPKICYKCVCGRGFVPDPAGGAHNAPLDPVVGWGGGYPLPTPHSLGACGASTLSPVGNGVPPMFFLQIRHWFDWLNDSDYISTYN